MVVQDYGFGLCIIGIQSLVKIKHHLSIIYRQTKPCAWASIAEEVKCVK